jgi:hypothetical protein
MAGPIWAVTGFAAFRIACAIIWTMQTSDPTAVLGLDADDILHNFS